MEEFEAYICTKDLKRTSKGHIHGGHLKGIWMEELTTVCQNVDEQPKFCLIRSKNIVLTYRTADTVTTLGWVEEKSPNIPHPAFC